jgi:hypothetical protein
LHSSSIKLSLIVFLSFSGSSMLIRSDSSNNCWGRSFKVTSKWEI